MPLWYLIFFNAGCPSFLLERHVRGATAVFVFLLLSGHVNYWRRVLKSVCIVLVIFLAETPVITLAFQWKTCPQQTSSTKRMCIHYMKQAQHPAISSNPSPGHSPALKSKHTARHSALHCSRTHEIDDSMHCSVMTTDVNGQPAYVIL